MSSVATKTASVLGYVYTLIGVAAVSATILVLVIYSTLRAEEQARDRISRYYMTTTSLAEGLRRDLDSLDFLIEMSDFAGNRRGPGDAFDLEQGTSLSGALYSIGEHITQIRDLQTQYGERQFAATLARLDECFANLLRLLENQAPIDNVRAEFTALDLQVEQLYRLHRIATEESLAGITTDAAVLLPNLLFLATILGAAILASWYVTRLLKRSIAREAEAEEALAASREHMHQMQKMEALGQLVGGVAHDFNNLLTAILGQAGLLREIAARDPQMRNGIDQIRQAAKQAASLTSQLLAFSRRQPLERVLFDPNDLIREMEPTLRRLIREDITLEFSYDASAGAVDMDPGQMRQVILNLIINARDAIAQKGTISLTTKRVQQTTDNLPKTLKRDAYVRITVIDNGSGIDKATQARIFEPFFTTKEHTRGTGLGLATVHGIVSGADGEIFVDGAPGRGTRFDVYIPSAGSEAAYQSATRLSPIGTEIVLLVEDEDQIRDVLHEGLVALGYRVLTAANGAEGLSICSDPANEIDVIVSDVVMPGMTGVDFMKAALGMRPEVVAIYTSGYSADVIMEQGMEGLDIPLLQKPFEVDTLARMIRAGVNERRFAPRTAVR